MEVPVGQLNLEKILAKANEQKSLSGVEVRYLLSLEEPEQIELLFAAARNVRQKFFGNKVFLYGFVYFSTWCRNDCTFCFYGSSNKQSHRYRKSEEEIIKIACQVAQSGVHLLDLTMGEDMFYYNNEKEFINLVKLVEKIKVKTQLPIMVSPGAVPSKFLKYFKDAGADWFACYQETHNQSLFNKLRVKQNYHQRLNKKYQAQEEGLLIEEGILTGIGDTIDDMATSLEEIGKMKAHQVRVMSFVPQKGTSMEKWFPPARMRELVCIAVMRLLFPDRLIPASLDVDGIKGLEQRMNAGANVITSLIPPDAGLQGVSQSNLDINEGYRTVQGVRPVLEQLGLATASQAEYQYWLNNEKKALSH